MSPLVIIVAGPSGSGKSTFIEQLQLGKIDGAIRRHLPASCECWPVIGATRPTPEAMATVKRWIESGRQPGLILHYDNSFIFRTSEKSHEKTADRELFLAGGSPMIVSARPTAGQLKKQFEHRLNRQQASKNWLRNAWRSVRTPIKLLLQKMRGQPGIRISRFYESGDWLRDCDQRWQAFVEGLRREHPDVLTLDIEPCEATSEPAFRVCKASGMQ
jgi:GTPase SAR1 family protein